MLPLIALSAEQRGERLHSRLAASVMRTREDSSPLEQARGWNGVLHTFYGRLRYSLQQRWDLSPEAGPDIVNVYAFGYDWRQTNRVSGRLLKDRIQEMLTIEHPATQVILITHSMGGLVARSAMKDGASSLVKGVIHVVQPAVGAVVAYRRFKTGAQGGTLFHDGDFGLTRILGRNPLDYALVSYGLRGPLELLPSNHYSRGGAAAAHHWLTWDSEVARSITPQLTQPPGNVYAAYREPTGNLGLFKSRGHEDEHIAEGLDAAITGAEGFHRDLGVWAHPNTFVIAVSGHATDIGTHVVIPYTATGLLVDETADTTNHINENGDGTVPLESQTILAVPPSQQHVFTAASGAPGHADVFHYDPILRTTTDLAARIVRELPVL